MGVDYTAHYGIGVRVTGIPDEYEGDILEYLEDIDEEETNYIGWEYFEVGSGRYSGEEDEVYVCISEPCLKDLDTLAEQKKHFVLFLERNGIEYGGEVDLVGGLLVW